MVEGFIPNAHAVAHKFDGSDPLDLTGYLRANVVLVASLADFPTPVANVITLADNTSYEISGTIDISPNRIVCGTKNIIRGLDRSNDILTSNTAGALITCDSSSVVKTIVTFDRLTLTALVHQLHEHERQPVACHHRM